MQVELRRGVRRQWLNVSAVASVCLGVMTYGAVAASKTGIYAPYIDMSLWDSAELQPVMSQSGVKTLILSFVDADTQGGCNPYWEAIGPIDDDYLPAGSQSPTTTVLQQVAAVRAAGGNVIISFGGELGEELALACSTVQDLQAAYQAVVTRYQATSLDFDIEGGNAQSHATFQIRDQALLALQVANPGLQISYTLSATTTGLGSDGVAALAQAAADGFSPGVINAMAEDYGMSQTAKQMGADAITVAEGTKSQVAAAGLNSVVGVTVENGYNSPTEEYTLTDAKQLVKYAGTNSWIGRLSMWSTSRDNGTCAGDNSPQPTCSGLKQKLYAFSKLFDKVVAK